MERHTLAYLIIALMAAAIIGWGIFRWHYGRERTYHRRQSRETVDYRKRMEKNETEENP